RFVGVSRDSLERGFDCRHHVDCILLNLVRSGSAIDGVFLGVLGVDDVVAGFAVDLVGAVAAIEDVISIAALDDVVAPAALAVFGDGAADERIVAASADQVFDVGFDVVLLAGFAVIRFFGGRTADIDDDALGARGVGDGVDAFAAAHAVSAQPAVEQVVAGS